MDREAFKAYTDALRNRKRPKDAMLAGARDFARTELAKGAWEAFEMIPQVGPRKLSTAFWLDDGDTACVLKTGKTRKGRRVGFRLGAEALTAVPEVDPKSQSSS